MCPVFHSLSRHFFGGLSRPSWTRSRDISTCMLLHDMKHILVCKSVEQLYPLYLSFDTNYVTYETTLRKKGTKKKVKKKVPYHVHHLVGRTVVFIYLLIFIGSTSLVLRVSINSFVTRGTLFLFVFGFPFHFYRKRIFSVETAMVLRGTSKKDTFPLHTFDWYKFKPLFFF